MKSKPTLKKPDNLKFASQPELLQSLSLYGTIILNKLENECIKQYCGKDYFSSLIDNKKIFDSVHDAMMRVIIGYENEIAEYEKENWTKEKFVSYLIKHGFKSNNDEYLECNYNRNSIDIRIEFAEEKPCFRIMNTFIPLLRLTKSNADKLIAICNTQFNYFED